MNQLYFKKIIFSLIGFVLFTGMSDAVLGMRASPGSPINSQEEPQDLKRNAGPKAPSSSEKAQEQPAAHVLMPVYNAQKFVLTAIQSVLDQAYPNTKLFVYDDGSTDGSLQKIEEFLQGKQELKDKVFVQSIPHNKGVSHARSQLWKWSRTLDKGAYHFWLDSDDLFTDRNYTQTVIETMLRIKADICLVNFSLAFEDEGVRANAMGLLRDKENYVNIMRTILSFPTQSVGPLELENVFGITSLGCVKVYGPEIELPEAANCSFEDFVFMAVLLKAVRITALLVEYEPVQFLRRSTSICGQRKPENFTHDIPTQLRRFFDVVVELSKDKPERARMLNLALGFVESKFNQYTLTLENILIAKTFPDINEDVLKLFLIEALTTKTYMQEIIEREIE